MLKDCRKGNCPTYFSDDIFYALADVSLEGYVLQKAYHFSNAEFGINDNERYFKALGEINNVLVCKKEPKLNINLFNQDSRQVYYKTDTYRLPTTVKIALAYNLYTRAMPQAIALARRLT